MKYTIREIEARDNHAVEHLIRTCLIEFGGNREGLAWCDPDLGRFSEIYNKEGYKYWVAEDDAGNIVGGVGIGGLKGADNVCELQKMYCLKEARGTGIAHELMKLSLEYAKQYYDKCYLETLSNMIAANKFYVKYGFERLDKPYLDTGHYACDVWYIKDLKMTRPYIICHMVTSIDGKVTGNFLYSSECEMATEEYYQINRDFQADAFACGRVTMEGSFTGGWYPDLAEFTDIKMEREDYVADREAGFYAVAFDRQGRLGWKGSKIVDEDPGYGNAHIIEVLCEGAPDAYLAYLKKIGVSYIFAGKAEMDLLLALEKLRTLFGIEKLLLEGGSIINGAFLQEHVVDELSLVVAPVIADAVDKPVFYGSDMKSFELMQATTVNGGNIWLRYRKK